MGKIKNKLVWFLVSASLLSILAGCPPAKKPLPGPRGAGGLKEEPTITLYINETGQKKNIKIEEYLQGVVASEMEPTWPVEALAAQAILARTFTMEKISKGGVPAHGTDASTSVEEFQAYDPKRINNNVRKAVQMTRGEVVKYKGKYVHAWFHADSGGVTASAVEGLAYRKEPTPYIKSGIKDPGQKITVPENKSWTATFPLSMVRQVVKEKAGMDTGTINAGNVKIVKKGPSGRAVTVKIGKAVLSAPALRLALGNDKMRSTLIDKFTVYGNDLVIHGKGYGHGVGMSQWGANYLARKGKRPEDIVKYYFKNVDIVKEWR